MGIYVEYLDRAFSFADLTKERKKQLGRIAELRQRRVLVIAAEVQNRLAGLSHEDLLAIGDQLSNDNDGEAIDIILETPGGSGEAAEDIVRLIQHHHITRPDGTQGTMLVTSLLRDGPLRLDATDCLYART